MNKWVNKTSLITTIICLLPILLALLLYDKLPEQIAIHFDISGKPDNYMPKASAIFGLPVLLSAINLYSHFRLNHDPKSENASSALKQVSKWVVPLISVIIVPITLFMAMGAAIPISVITTAIVGVVIVVCGNYLPKCRRNYTVGIRLPWTLDNEDNWNKTHRFAGFVWVIGGIAFIADSFFPSAYVIIGIIVLLVTIPLIYSYLTYKTQHGAGE